MFTSMGFLSFIIGPALNWVEESGGDFRPLLNIQLFALIPSLLFTVAVVCKPALGLGPADPFVLPKSLLCRSDEDFGTVTRRIVNLRSASSVHGLHKISARAVD